MKKVINTLLIVAIIAISAGVELYSQGTTRAKKYHKAITTDPIDLLNSDRFNVKYEQNVGKDNSFTADLIYNYAYNDVVGIAIGGGYRWYFHNLSPELITSGIKGLAVGPFAQLNYLRYEVTKDNFNDDFGLDVGVEATYKFVVFDWLAIEPALRLGWGLSRAGYYTTGFLLRPGVSIGYAW